MTKGATMVHTPFKLTRALCVKFVDLDNDCSLLVDEELDGVFTRERAYNFSRVLLDYALHKSGCPMRDLSLDTVVSDHWPICNCGLSVMQQQLKVWGHYVN